MPISEEVLLNRPTSRLYLALLCLILAACAYCCTKTPQAPVQKQAQAVQIEQEAPIIQSPPPATFSGFYNQATPTPKPKPTKLQYAQSPCKNIMTDILYAKNAAPIFTKDGCAFQSAIILARTGSGILNQYYQCQNGPNPESESAYFDDLDRFFSGPCLSIHDTLSLDLTERIYLESTALIDSTYRKSSAVFVSLYQTDYQQVVFKNNMEQIDTLLLSTGSQYCVQGWARKIQE